VTTTRKTRKTGNEPLTDEMIRALAPKAQRYAVWDGKLPGLGVRVTPTGAKTWVYQRRPQGSPRPLTTTLGRVGEIDCYDAREKVRREVLPTLREGRNPTDAKRQKTGRTFGAVIESYIKLKLPKLRRGWLVEQNLRTVWLDQTQQSDKVWKAKAGESRVAVRWEDHGRTRFRHRAVAGISRDDLLERINEVRAERGVYSARRAMSTVRAALNWGARQPHAGFASPAATLKDIDLDLTAKSIRRKRTLTDDELRAIWTACGHESMGAFGAMVRVLMLTGQRRTEIAHARWAEVSHNRQLLVVPAERYKTASEHSVPLSTEVLAILKELPRWKGSPFVFSNKGTRPIINFDKPKARLDKLSGVKRWRLHDLRRTCRTKMRAELKIAPSTCEAVLGHLPEALIQTYDTGGFEEEKRTALERWAKHLLAIVLAIVEPKPLKAAA
jgi:integrase